MSINGALPEINELSSTADPKVRTLLSELKAEVNALAEVQHAVKWYEPKVIAAEQSTSSTSFTTLATPDEITGIVVPTNGLLVVTYLAVFKTSSGLGHAEAAIFLNNEQLKVRGAAQVAASASTGEAPNSQLSTFSGGLIAEKTGFIGSTPEAVAVNTSPGAGGSCLIRATPGTYTVSVRYKAPSGNTASALQRFLWVEVHGA